MENKYFEALDYIVCATNGGNGLAHQINILDELVQKATPKKPNICKGFYYDMQYSRWRPNGYRCQSCNTEVSYKNYCPSCGQKLDWSKESEDNA